MQIIGFGFTKISAEKKKNYKKGLAKQTNIEFSSIEKEELNILKDGELIKASFNFSLFYRDPETKDESEKTKEAEIIINGIISLSATKDEAKDILNEWKKRKLSPGFKISVFNLILRKCSLKAAELEEEIGLPSHLALPQISSVPEDTNKK